MKNQSLVLLSLCFLLATSCAKTSASSATDNTETAQQVGDAMASIDESGGSTGSIAYQEMNSTEKMFARMAPNEVHDSWLKNIFTQNAYASSCSTASTFGTCAAHTLTRTFGGCTLGAATFSGTVGFDWTHTSPSSTCTLGLAGDYVTRTPNFTVTGRRGATLSVTATATNAQRLTYVSGSSTSRVFQFDNAGINRKFTAAGSTLFDFTTTTTSPITVTGTSRSSRTLTGGALRVTNNLTQATCDYVPNNVSWTSGCNCPTSGSWSGTCSDGTTTSITLTGCGTGSLTLGGTSSDVAFDRCGT